jgi:hypothetical protein
MIRKSVDLPPAIASVFIKDMEAYFAEEDGYRRDAIAARQLFVLRKIQGPRERPLRLSDVKRTFLMMNNKG